jgi:5-methylcytosine-specific restriction endonuclease McrA
MSATLFEPPPYLGKPRKSWEPVLRRDPCAYCALRPGHWRQATLDHVNARAVGGPNTVDNIVGACPACNSSKGSRSLLLYLLARREEAIRA